MAKFVDSMYAAELSDVGQISVSIFMQACDCARSGRATTGFIHWPRPLVSD
ncbi:hypothetical protein FOPG_15430 [Fusarium oxysporum f. sp. conglutinans race 2 54008]|uniref:Uncharacterized protein n=2 Tax=Fusarium oxysporum TaxID=5507 RepID=X0I5F2_FUSOX|nr:hypothetical protein FOVG_19501 [Fusarium oxysporum f. sp. pisi HDV247]EXL68514.1 hypothetical protein FOPG_15430 [Fusarium oxysporum f. sp. conglutinans race 2 54008]